MTTSTDSRQTRCRIAVLTAQARLLQRRRECASYKAVSVFQETVPTLLRALAEVSEADANLSAFLETHGEEMNELENETTRGESGEPNPQSS